MTVVNMFRFRICSDCEKVAVCIVFPSSDNSTDRDEQTKRDQSMCRSDEAIRQGLRKYILSSSLCIPKI